MAITAQEIIDIIKSARQTLSNAQTNFDRALGEQIFQGIKDLLDADTEPKLSDATIRELVQELVSRPEIP